MRFSVWLTFAVMVMAGSTVAQEATSPPEGGDSTTSAAQAAVQEQERESPPEAGLQQMAGGLRAPDPSGGIPGGLATLRNYRPMRISSEDRKGNADMRRIEPGETLLLGEMQGPGEITHIWTTIATSDPDHLRNVVFRIYYDGNDYPSVESPVGDFFGLGHGKYYVFDNPVQAIGTDKGMNCFWPMPFQKSAKVTATNEGPKRIDAYYYYLDWRKFESLPTDVGYFHAQYLQAFPAPAKKNYLILDADGGRGHFCGVSMSIHTQSGGWWGEGDDIFTIDGEATPSLWGTGSEDYFCGAWCYGATFYNNYFGMPLRTKLNHEQDNYWNVYRLHLESPIAFNNSLKVEIEHGIHGFDNERGGRTNNHSSVAYWYQEKPMRLKGQLPPAAERITKFNVPNAPEGVIELQYGQTNAPGAQVEAQTMDSFSGPGNEWVNRDHLWLKDVKEGQKAEITFEVKNAMKGPGVLRVTSADDYGKARISLDGKVVAVVDAYAPKVRAKAIGLGDLDLQRGAHKLTVEITGKNAESRNTYFGIDYLRVGATAPALEGEIEPAKVDAGGAGTAAVDAPAQRPGARASEGRQSGQERPARAGRPGRSQRRNR